MIMENFRMFDFFDWEHSNRKSDLSFNAFYLFSINVSAWLDSDSGSSVSNNWGSISSISIWMMEKYSWVSFTLLTACTWNWSSVSVVASVAKGVWMS